MDKIKIGITGHTGFLGTTLKQRLEDDFDVWGIDQPYSLSSDIDDNRMDYIFHFAAPSSQVLFNRNPAQCIGDTIKGMQNMAVTAKATGAKLIYMSTGLASGDKLNEYSMTKLLCEKIAQDLLPNNSVGIRLFAAYGPGEGHKQDYASVPYVFADRMLRGLPAVIWGDGEQTRDFIHIDDAIDGIIHLAFNNNSGVHELGSGEDISFNRIVELINSNLDKEIKPVNITRPKEYVEETKAKTKWTAPGFDPMSIEDGIRDLVTYIKEYEQ